MIKMRLELAVGCWLLAVGLALGLIVCGCTNGARPSAEKGEQYTCPMHPTVVRDGPGACPVCGMDLVRKGQPGEEVKITATLNYLLKPTNAMVMSTIRTITPVKQTLETVSIAPGIITYDTRRFTTVPIRTGGRIEKLLVKYNFQPVRKGQKILEVYSPELLTAQREFLYLLKSDHENQEGIAGAKEKLAFLGVSESQIAQLVSTGKETNSFAVYSPVDGYVVESVTLPVATSVTKASTTAMGEGMEANGAGKTVSPAPARSSESRMREGMYVTAGQSIFTVINTQVVWAEFEVNERDAAYLKTNDAVHLTTRSATDTTKAKVNFIQPFFKDGERFMNVRVQLNNSTGQFRIGQLVSGTFTTAKTTASWIPLSARIVLGTSEVAFVKRRGVFRPVSIATSRQSGDWLAVIGGLVAGDSVAYNAQFMVDTESFIKVRN